MAEPTRKLSGMHRRHLPVASATLLALALWGCGDAAKSASDEPDTTTAPATVGTNMASSSAATLTATSASVTSATATATAGGLTGAGGTGTSSVDAGATQGGSTGQMSANGTGTGTGTTGGGGGSSTGAFPFPQNVESEHCVYPAYDNNHVRDAYAAWKEAVITSDGAGGYLRVRKPDSGSVVGSTVSEGIGYGMLLAVYFGEQELFDNLWLYAKLHFNENGLMHWEVHPEGYVIGTGAALDGDEDMAWALVMASRQWGTSVLLDDTYHNEAVRLIEAMWEHEIDHGRGGMPLPGDTWGGSDVTNISYFAPAYYRVFGEITDNVAGWQTVIDTSYAILELSLNESYGNADNGLVPAWCTSSGVPVEAFEGAPTHFQNDSTRTPFRVGQDYCYYGEPRALAYLEKIASFYEQVGVENIVDGYDLDGTPHPEFSVNGLQPASFVGPAGVAAMAAGEFQSFLDGAYLAVASGELTAGTTYYQKSWTALSLLMLTGNFIELR